MCFVAGFEGLGSWWFFVLSFSVFSALFLSSASPTGFLIFDFFFLIHEPGLNN